jgi:hypothetical protein
MLSPHTFNDCQVTYHKRSICCLPLRSFRESACGKASTMDPDVVRPLLMDVLYNIVLYIVYRFCFTLKRTHEQTHTVQYVHTERHGPGGSHTIFRGFPQPFRQMVG